MDIYWNGEPCQGRQVRVRVPTWDAAKHPPLAWWRPHQGQIRAAIEVLYFDQRHLLDDEDGSGTLKVTEGRGSPRLGHKDLPWDAQRIHTAPIHKETNNA